MRPSYGMIAVLVMFVIYAPAYGAEVSTNTSPGVGSYFDDVLQFFQRIISSLMQAINKQLPSS
jgi:hypothetical protein